MLANTLEFTLNKVEYLPFKDKDGKEVKYYKASITDADGDNSSMTVDVELGDKLLGSTNVYGSATVDIKEKTFNGKTKTAVKIIGFQESKPE